MCLSCLGSTEAEGVHQKFTRVSFSQHGVAGALMRDTEACSLRMKLKGIIMMCGFVRIG